MFTKAIVRIPCRNMIYGLTESNEGTPDYSKALQQHSKYIETLEYCGLDVTVLPEDENFPDSTFVEDVALLTQHCAIITRPGVQPRRDETISIKKVLTEFYDNIDEIASPGTVDAGDIMMVGTHYYIGLSKRTNLDGANQIIKILEKYDLTGSTVPLSDMLHLKSGVAYLENNHLVVTGEFIHNAEFQKYNLIKIDENENYAANCVWINDYVLIAKGYPKAKRLIEQAGYKIFELEMSEFRKLDGGLSCLSLRF